MEIVYYLVFLTVGLVAGGLMAWLAMRQSVAMVEERAKGAAEAERIRLATELNTANKKAADFSQQLDSSKIRIEQLSDEKSQERERRAAAEEKATRICALEDEIKEFQRKIQGQAESNEQKITLAYEKVAKLETMLEKEREAAEEKLALVEEARQRLADTFDALSKKALDDNSKSFVQHAQSVLEGYHRQAQDDLQRRQERISEIVTPVRDALEKFEHRIQDIEKNREGAYQGLLAQVNDMKESNRYLRSETTKLGEALRGTKTRGQWGEIQLRRVIELAGMLEHCDYQEQANVTVEDGRFRPDVVIKLPAGRTIAVDAKAPMEGFLDAQATTDENERRQHLNRHAKHLRAHITNLKVKSYQSRLQLSFEFVVLFLPNEALYSAALERDPKLIEDGAADNVIIATPVTLIALLKAAAYGWQQEAIAKEAREIGERGRKLYESLATFCGHITSLGQAINSSIKHYDAMIGSLERNVLSQARHFTRLKAVSTVDKTIEEGFNPINREAREIQKTELLPVSSNNQPLLALSDTVKIDAVTPLTLAASNTSLGQPEISHLKRDN